MTQITLTPTERETLAGVLESVLSDLRMEIAATDRQEFRDRLKGKRDVLNAILDRLSPSEGDTPG